MKRSDLLVSWISTRIKSDRSFYQGEKGVEHHHFPSGEAQLDYLKQAMMGSGLGDVSAINLMTKELLLYGQDENKWRWIHSSTIDFNS
jgi:hypothetical protein